METVAAFGVGFILFLLFVFFVWYVQYAVREVARERRKEIVAAKEARDRCVACQMGSVVLASRGDVRTMCREHRLQYWKITSLEREVFGS